MVRQKSANEGTEDSRNYEVSCEYLTLDRKSGLEALTSPRRADPSRIFAALLQRDDVADDNLSHL